MLLFVNRQQTLNPMADKMQDYEDYNLNTATNWPVTGTYTTPEGIEVKVYKAAYVAAGINKFSVRAKKARNLVGL